MLQIDFKEHNRKSEEIWKAYRTGNPTRVPVPVAGGHALSEAMQNLLDVGDLPDALFFGSDQIAFEAIPILVARGIRIPQDIAIGRFDQDVHLGTGFPMPTLTTIAQPLRDMGKDAIDLLYAAIRGSIPEPRTHLFKGRFIKGDTT